MPPVPMTDQLTREEIERCRESLAVHGTYQFCNVSAGFLRRLLAAAESTLSEPDRIAAAERRGAKAMHRMRFAPPGRPMDEAPKDRPLLTYCRHDADPYVEPKNEKRLTTYGAHCEGLAHASDGFQVVVWGGEYRDADPNAGPSHHVPAWWFVEGSDFEIPANPICWWPLPDLVPAAEEDNGHGPEGSHP